MAIYTQYISSVGYLVMAEDRKSDGWKDRWNDGRLDGQHKTDIPPPSAEDDQLRYDSF